MTEFTKSIKSILNDRISSPFYGTLIVSWLLWNWKIPYVTFFIDSDKLSDNKIDYIVKNCNDFNHLVTYPLISTVIILTILPFVTNGAYWITIIFDKWKNDKKNEVERNQLLTLEQSIQLRTEIQTQEDKFEKLLKNKNDEIMLLKQQIDIGTKSNIINQTPTAVENNYNHEITEFLQNHKVLQYVEKVVSYAQTGYRMQGIPEDVLSYFVANDLIENKSTGIFGLTEKGKLFMREYLKQKSQNE